MLRERVLGERSLIRSGSATYLTVPPLLVIDREGAKSPFSLVFICDFVDSFSEGSSCPDDLLRHGSYLLSVKALPGLTSDFVVETPTLSVS